MSCVFLTGPNFNLFARSGASVASSPAASSDFPLTALYDRQPGTIFQFGSLGADPTITLDLTDGVGGFGGFNAWTGGSPDGWTETNVTGGTVTQDSVNKHEGASSAAFTPGAGGSCSLHRDVSGFRTGWYYRLTAYGINLGVGSLALICRIQNLTTNRFWNGSAWVSGSTPTAFNVGQDLSWTQQGTTFQVEGYEACRAETVTLRITFQAPSDPAGDVSNLDLVEVYPGVDFASVHGHNIDPLIAVTLRSSTDNFSGSDTAEATLTTQFGAFYGVLGSRVYRRYWRFKFTGTNTSQSGAIYLGEGVISQALALSKAPAIPVRLRFRTPQIRTPNLYGAGGAYGVSRFNTIGMGLDFKQEEAHFREFFHEVFLRSIAGTPMVVVPDTSDALGITYGRLPEAYDLARVLTTFRELSTIDIEPLPLPMVVG